MIVENKPDLAARVIKIITDIYPQLIYEDALTFLQVCADEVISLKSLSKRLGLAQSEVMRTVTELQQVGRVGLVEVVETREDGLRRLVRLTDEGVKLRRTIVDLNRVSSTPA